MTDAFLGHPVYQFLQNPEFFNFIFNRFRLPWPSRLQKYVSMCLPNTNVKILLLPCCGQTKVDFFSNDGTPYPYVFQVVFEKAVSKNE